MTLLEIVDWRNGIYEMIPARRGKRFTPRTHFLWLWWDTLQQGYVDLLYGKRTHSYFPGVRLRGSKGE